MQLEKELNGRKLKINCHIKMEKVYILKKDCPKIGKEIGDYYNGEFRESIEDLLANGTIEEEVCEMCGGTGEITVDEPVYAGEPHMAPIGTKPCICQTKEDFEE